MIMKISKELLTGSTALMVLRVIAEEDMYGYRIMREIATRSKDTFKLNEGTLYPILYRLEDDGFIRATWTAGEGRSAPKKMYTATDRGREESARRAELWRTFVESVERCREGMQ